MCCGNTQKIAILWPLDAACSVITSSFRKKDLEARQEMSVLAVTCYSNINKEEQEKKDALGQYY